MRVVVALSESMNLSVNPRGGVECFASHSRLRLTVVVRSPVTVAAVPGFAYDSHLVFSATPSLSGLGIWKRAINQLRKAVLRRTLFG